MSRSATLLIAFLMIKWKLNMLQATDIVRKKRPVLPNNGFIRQLKQLDEELYSTKHAVMGDAGIDNDENKKSEEMSNTSKNDKEFTNSELETNTDIKQAVDECLSEIREDNKNGNSDKCDIQESVSNERQPRYSVAEIKQIMKDVTPEISYQKRSKKDGEAPRLLFVNRDLSGIIPCNRYDEVYPGIWLGDHSITRNMAELNRLGITHIVNTAQGQKFAQIDTSEAYYADIGAKFFGINAMDTSRYQMIKHFYSAADFIDDALRNGGKLYVHCHQGFSRSATVTLAFLMIKRNMGLVEAITTIRKRRAVMPNDGFISQLIELEEILQTSN